MGYRDRLSIKRYYKYKDEVIERNILASQTFIIVGSIIAIVYMFANIFVVRTHGYYGNIIVLAYFVLAAFIRTPILKKHPEKSTLFMYLIQIPIMITGILMSTMFDKDSESVVFFLFIVCLPPFILDNPLRHLVYIVA
jgi:uncharacterized membrane protein YiaA